MENKQAISGETWQRIDDLAWRIQERAIRKGDWQTAKDADLTNALLRTLTIEMWLEGPQPATQNVE
jgi:hypothetical protein